MKKRFTILIAAIAAILMMTQPVKVVGQTRQTDELLSENFSSISNGNSTGSNGSSTAWNGNTNFTVSTAYQAGGAVRLGSGSKTGSLTSKSLSVKEGTLTVAFDVKGWGASGEVTVTFNGTTKTVSYSTSAWNSSFESKSVDFTVNSDVSESVVLSTTSSYKRAFIDNIVISNTYNSGGGSLTTSDLTITNQSTTLSFDLTNNYGDQTITYSTTSTGAISIDPTESEYFTYTHDATNKTITVTPSKVTPSAQTVTINQLADATYAAGSVSFTVSITKTVTDISGLTSNTAAGTYNVTLTDAVVKFVSGNFAYIQDATGAIQLYKSGHSLTAGTMLNSTATVSYLLYNGNPRITDISGTTNTTGGNTDPTTVAQGSWNYTFANVLNQYFQITGATITTSNSNYYVSLGGESIQLYKSGSISTLDLTKTYTITGFPTMYNTTKELTIFADPEAEASTVPSITANDVTLIDVATSGSITYSVENPVNNFNLEASVTTGSDWLSIIGDPSGASEGTIALSCSANTDNTNRTATVMLTYEGASNKVVTVTQEKYFAPANINDNNFTWTSSYNTTPTGIKKYSIASENSYVKFDGSGDYIILKFNARPGTLNYEIKANPSSNAWSGTFKVQTSENGIDYTDKIVYDANNMLDISNYQSIEISDFGENVRYIKWVYTTKTLGNVALKNIQLAKYVAPTPTITVDPATVNNVPAAGTSGTITVTYSNIANVDAEVLFYKSDGETSATYSWVDAFIGEGNNVSYSIEANTGAARPAYMKVHQKNTEVYSELITINQAAYVAPTHTSNGDFIRISSLDLLTDGCKVIIAARYDEDHTNGYYAMPNSTSGKPKGVSFTSKTTVESDEILPSTIAGSEYISSYYWTVSITVENKKTYYTFTNTANPAQSIGYSSSTNFSTSNTTWTIERSTSEETAMVGEYTGFVIKNVNTNTRGFAFNGTAYGAYATSNMTGSGYNFFLDLFVQTYSLPITGCGDDAGHYYLIASPVASVTPNADNGLLAGGNGNYDLYRFNQSGENGEWENWRADHEDFTALVSGRGYLYANRNDVTIRFTGSLNSDDEATIDLEYDDDAPNFTGWNLVGNPLSTNATINKTSFYRMNEEGTDVISASGTVTVMEGIFVYASAEKQTITFTEDTGDKRSNDSKIVLNVIGNNDNLIDRAVVRFNENDALPKFMLDESNTKIYLPQDGSRYAVVSSEGKGTMPVNFKAK